MKKVSLARTDKSIELNILVKSSILALVLKFLGIICLYLLQICLVRWMGATEYGAYEYAIALSLLLATPVSLGLPRAVIRFISEYRVKQEWGLLRGIVLGSWQSIIAIGSLLCLLAMGILLWLDRQQISIIIPISIAGICLIPLQALVLLQEDMGRGAENLLLAYLPTKIIYPILAIAGAFFFWQQYHSLSSSIAIQIAAIALFAVIFMQALFLWQKFDREIPKTDAIYIFPKWLKVSLPLLLFQSLRSLQAQTDILMLGILVGTEAIGLYSPTIKTALWTSFILEAVNLVVAPAFAILHARGDRQGLQDLISNVTQWIFWPSTAIALFLFLFPKPILGLFGPELQSADLALKILVLGQLMNAFCGSVGNLLSVTGSQNQLMMASAIAALVNLGLNSIFIPLWGTVGAAITTSLTLILWNIGLVIIVLRNLQVNPTVFSAFFKTKT